MIDTYFFIEVSVNELGSSAGPVSLRYGPYTDPKEAHKMLLDELLVLLRADLSYMSPVYDAVLTERTTLNNEWITLRTVARDTNGKVNDRTPAP